MNVILFLPFNSTYIFRAEPHLRFTWSWEAMMTSRKKIQQEVLVDAWRNYDGEKVLLHTRYSKIEVNKLILAVHSPLLRLLLTDLQR